MKWEKQNHADENRNRPCWQNFMIITSMQPGHMSRVKGEKNKQLKMIYRKETPWLVSLVHKKQRKITGGITPQ